jgi:hypothetical protein
MAARVDELAAVEFRHLFKHPMKGGGHHAASKRKCLEFDTEHGKAVAYSCTADGAFILCLCRRKHLLPRGNDMQPNLARIKYGDIAS